MRPQYSEDIYLLANQNPPRELYATFLYKKKTLCYAKSICIHVQNTHATQNISEFFLKKSMFSYNLQFIYYHENCQKVTYLLVAKRGENHCDGSWKHHRFRIFFRSNRLKIQKKKNTYDLTDLCLWNKVEECGI